MCYLLISWCVWCYSHSWHQFRHINHYRYSGRRHTRHGRPLHRDPRQEMVSTSFFKNLSLSLPTYLTHLHNGPARTSISKCSALCCNENLNVVFKKEIKTIFELWHPVLSQHKLWLEYLQGFPFSEFRHHKASSVSGTRLGPPLAKPSSLELLLAASSNVIFIFSDFFNFPFHLPFENKHTDETLCCYIPHHQASEE